MVSTRKSRIAVCLSILLVLAPLFIQAADVPLNTTARVYFSPRGGATDALVKAIRSARTEVLVQAYSFTSEPIVKALADAHKRGVRTEIVLDKSNRTAKYSSAGFAHTMGIPTYIDAEHAIAHSKIMIIDRETVVTGSFNFSKAAEEKNAENLLIITSKELAKVYLENWQLHRKHSERYRPPPSRTARSPS
ncbi:MAG: phospholipase D family protein [Nitrospirota bacterium]